MAPVVGDAIGKGGKLGRFAMKHADEAPGLVRASAKLSDEASAAVNKAADSSRAADSLVPSAGKIDNAPSSAEPQTTILGNGQQTRVVPFAEKTGARTLDNGLTEAQWNKLTPKEQYKVNDGQLRKHVNDGDSFRDIGPDGQFRSLDLRKAELNRLKDRNIPLETVPKAEVDRVLGGN